MICSLWFDRFKLISPDAKVQILSTFLYSQYQEGGLNGVAKYTPGGRIWDMEFAIIPVHCIDHWVAIIIANPGGLLIPGDPS